ncbi:laccase, multicopper oxidase, benzenediol:oxygen oxidorectuctase [Entomophthora muscae]|uniref:Laccase, multicopper oxidase, benzenediol:oxygen oxidorectuctase n=1 Tax=Entomophthora muscae TaxID=34485 RepID=A0ACC2TFQ7_9FUNG|nr:laccase, multicopper oxidase, benzenediol:oxygen oxidorectuctase [Entomophthora muscae]
MLQFCIDGYKFFEIEVKGTLFELMEVDHTDVNRHKKYSVIINADQPISSYVGSLLLK